MRQHQVQPLKDNIGKPFKRFVSWSNVTRKGHARNLTKDSLHSKEVF